MRLHFSLETILSEPDIRKHTDEKPYECDQIQYLAPNSKIIFMDVDNAVIVL